jgi:hypothetical protein
MYNTEHYEKRKEWLINQIDYAIHNDNINEILDLSTESKPAVYDFYTMSIHRIHLDSSDERLPECKRQIRELKAEVHDWLKQVYGPEWSLRKPVDIPHQIDGDYIQEK